LSILLAGLPVDFGAAVVVVQHLDPRHRSLMAHILGRRTRMQVKEAEEADEIRPGCAYIAMPNRHLLVTPRHRLTLTDTTLVHFVRPSADLLFESVAAIYRDRAIAVVLTGSGIDASMGVSAIKKMGGTVIVQDPESAEFSGMPAAAVHTGQVDFVLALEEIPQALIKLVGADDD